MKSNQESRFTFKCMKIKVIWEAWDIKGIPQGRDARKIT